jgi:hypothetical protein
VQPVTHFHEEQVTCRMHSLLFLVIVFSGFSSAFVLHPNFLSGCRVPNIKNERKWHRDLKPFLSSPKSVENDADSTSVVKRCGESCDESSTAVVITGANGVLGESLIWYSSTLIAF